MENRKIKIFDPIYIKALKLISEIHNKSRKNIDVLKKDKKLAIYYLQGGCITHAYLSIKQWMNRDLGAPFVHKRIIDESKNLALFLSAIPDEHRYISSFFDKKIVTMPKTILNKNKYQQEREYILCKMGWTFDTFKKYLENAKKLECGFSNAVHPQIETVAFNSDKYNGEYDYDLSKHFNNLFIRNFDFGHYIIIPAMDSIHMNRDILPISEEDEKKFLDLRDDVSVIGMDIFENLRDSKLKKQ